MRKLLLALLIPVALFGQSGGNPINIPVTASGWKFGNNTGPYGTNGCFAGNGTAPCTQDLGISPAALQEHNGYITPGFFTVTFTVANYFQNYPAYYTVEIDYGTQQLCDADAWGTERVNQIIYICGSPGYLIIDHSLPVVGPPQGSKNLVLSLHGSNWEDLFDNVSLTFTPTN